MPDSNKKIKIYFTYHTIDTPRGGANSLTRATKKAFMQSDDFEVMQTPASDCDVLFMFQFRTGPALGGLYTINYDAVRKMQKNNTKVIVKALNLGYLPEGYMDPTKVHYEIRKLKDIKKYLAYKKQERKKRSLLHTADNVIFESEFQREMYSRRGYKGSSWSIVYNGADSIFVPSESAASLDGAVRMLSCGTSKMISYKKHSLMAEMSECEGVEMHYAGEWPESIDPCNIRLHGVLSHTELAKLWKTMHYCFHPANYDICPNAVCEALASGIPVIYNPNGGGTAELASKSGIALQEDNLQATVREAREQYEKLSGKARENWEHYTIDRACREYMDVIKRCI